MQRSMHTHGRMIWGGAVLVLSTARATTATQAAAGRADRTAVEVAALRAVAGDRVARTDLALDRAGGVVFDRRVGRGRVGDAARPVWPAAYARRLARVLGAPVVDGDRPSDRTPGSGGDATCRGLVPGGPALVSLGAAVLRGDSAFVAVTTRFPPGGPTAGCFFARRELVLRRVGGRWQVVPDAGWLVRS